MGKLSFAIILWFIARGTKQTGKTLFINAGEMGHMVDRSHRDLSDDDINKIATTVKAFQAETLEDKLGFCKVATTEEIAEQDYILTPGRYVGIPEEDDIPFEEKMDTLTLKLSEMFDETYRLEDEIRKNLKVLGFEI